MEIYKLDLHRRTGSNLKLQRENFEKAEQKEEPSEYDVIGYYDYLRVSKLKNLSYMFIEKGGPLAQPSNYSRHSLVLFEISPEERPVNKIMERLEKGEVNQFAILISCVLSTKTFEKKEPDPTGQQVLSDAKNRFCAMLENKLQGINARFQVLGNLGNFDITLVVESTDLARLIMLPTELREEKDEGECFIKYSSSFIACDMDKLDMDELEKCNQENLVLSRRIATFDASQDEKIIRKLQEEFKHYKDKVFYSRVVGEYAIELVFRNLRVKDIVAIYKSDWFYRKCVEGKYFKFFRSIYSLVGTEVGEVGDDCGEPQPVSLDWNNQASTMIVELRKILDGMVVPQESAHNLGKCIEMIIAMLNCDLKHYLGQQLIMMFIDTFTDAKKSYELITDNNKKDNSKVEIWAKNLEWLVMRCSMLVNSVHPAGSFLQDGNLSQNEVDSVLKILLAYQQIARDIFRTMDPNEEHPKTPKHIFVTIGAESIFYTRIFEWPMIGKNLVVSLDFPSYTNTSLMYIAEVFAHEVSHAIRLNAQEKLGMDLYDAMHQMLIRFHIQLIIQMKNGIKDIKKIPSNSIKGEIEMAEGLIRKVLTGKYGGHEDLKVFPAQMNRSNLSAFKDEWADISHQLTLRVGYEGVSNFTLSAGAVYTKVLCKACIEARADALMIYMCEFNLQSYLNLLFRYFYAYLRDPFFNDPEFTYRLTAILCMFYLKHLAQNGLDKSDLSVKKWWSKECENLTADEKDIVERFGDKVLTNLAVMEQVAEYMISLKNIFDDNLAPEVVNNNPGEDGAEVIKILKRLASRKRDKDLLRDEVWLYVNAWYRGRRDNHDKWKKRQESDKWADALSC